MKKSQVAKKEPVILVTNDDSVAAPGIHALVEAAKGLGRVVVVAPDKPQSGMGHAITINQPLRLSPVPYFGDDIEAWQVNGTPVDCVKLAVDRVIKGHPTICVSGINHGANHSINVIYSGTMSAALEAGVEGIPSIGFSLLDYSLEADFSGAQAYATKIMKTLLSLEHIDKHTCLNVNIPAVPESLINGVKVCRQAYGKYEEHFDERKDPSGKKYYWLTGAFVNNDKEKDTDVWALENNYISVVPVTFDMTNYPLKEKLAKSFKF
ncbi:MAG: 5'/3'-nucleotidase SurE [Pseudopedobacter saltans]|uniref:5'-nucleotidase SurE n=1 Tax=Pseudopedobacter saltans TaxID=151895 RepID=A0A2W5GNH6_9SPHI|nr:MAG: 5'/3'-nucleotidase SurE [Pseudopedobacter saltans]